MEEEGLEKVEEDRLRPCLGRVLEFAEGEGWKGYDPYDGLLSPLGRLPFSPYRLLFQQVLKRSPLFLRRLLLVPKSHNPKGLALFLWTYSNLKDGEKAKEVFRILWDHRTDLPSGGVAFGYNFNWQSSVFYVPAYTPNVIATSFAVLAINSANRTFGWGFDLKRFLPFYEDVLNLFRDENGRLWMSYTPLDRRRIFNASILGAVAYVIAGGKSDVLIEIAQTLTHYQRDDGSWVYGLGSGRMNYVDHIHTAYNLWGLKWAREMTGRRDWDTALEKGLNFYLRNLFDSKGLPVNRLGRNYYDTHDIAAAIITLKTFRRGEWARRLESHACKRLVGPRGEVFNSTSDRRVFIRWSVAWLALALSWPAALE